VGRDGGASRIGSEENVAVAHDTENCGVITHGELILTAGGSEQRFGPGAWYRLAPGQIHAARFEVETSEIEFWFRA